MTQESVLLKQYKLLGAVIDAPWATRLDHKVARTVIDRHFAKFGNARASLRYLEQATGSGRNKIVPSLRRLTEHGVFSIIRQGIGTRPTEYALNFEFSNGALQGTSTSSAPQGTSEVPQTAPLAASSGALQGTESYLPSMLTSMLTVSRNEDTPAVPSAPHVSGGATASTAGSAVDPVGGFEELWSVYPRKHHRSKAQAAYKALAPDAILHTTLVEKAAQWAAHYEQTATEKQWWKHLHRWLEDECYLEDLPVAYQDPKEAAITRRASGKTQSAGKSSTSMQAPFGLHRLTVTGANIVTSTNGDETLDLEFRILGGPQDGKEFSHSILFHSEEQDSRLEGQNKFAEFCKAAGRESPQDASDFVNSVLHATVNKNGVRYGIGV